MKIDKIQMNRRSVLKATAALVSSTTLGLTACTSEKVTAKNNDVLKGAIGEDGQRVQPWYNWSRNQSCEHNKLLVPKDTDELASMIKQSKQNIRLVGSGHSFSALVPTNESLMTLAYFTGISSIDKQLQQFDVKANTTLAGVGDELWKNGLSLTNMPDINTQTFGGAIATSTHGTGKQFGSMSSTIKELTLINGLGEELICSPKKNTELFDAARTNIGTLGAITSFKVQAQKKYYLKETSWMMDLEEGLAKAESLRDQHRHFELYALPHADYILGITLDEVEEYQLIKQEENNGDAYETFKTLSKVVDAVPFLRSFIVNTGASTVTEEKRTGKNYDIFGNLRDIRFNEMEYSVPAEFGMTCLKEILDTIKKQDIDIIFPLEVRYIKADNIWLSPFYQQDCCAISCHNFHDKDYKKYFAAIEPIFWKYQGRPHWGKIHTLTAKEQRAKYPKFAEFLTLRKEMDPNNIFTNSHINSVLGLT